jgi:vacuolar-type H+-ATPase subunit H
MAENLPEEKASRRIKDARKNAEKFVGDFDEKSSNMSSEQISKEGESIIQNVKSLIF